ncbi:MAG: Uma2 family endonuclease, partial [Dolichospermum sp.]
TKAKAYSLAGIKDYWVLDVVKRELHIFRNPTQNGYESEIIIAEDGIVSALEFPDLQISLSDMLPPFQK